MLRVGLVGTGDAGAHHARALATLAAEPGAAVAWTAVAARDPARVAAFRAAHGVPASVATFASGEALMASGACDAVVLATPDGHHAAQVIAAAGRGLHVLVEKPLALRAEDGARAVAAARAAGVRLGVGYHLRHHAAHRLLRARRDTLVGTLRTIHVRWAWPDPATDGWRARGEGARFWSLAALGTHGIDLALALGGAPPTAAPRVAGLRTPAAGPDRQAEVTFELGGGALAHVAVSVAHRAVSRLVVSGDAGEVEALGTLGARGGGELWHRAPRAPAVPVPFDPVDPYVAQLRAFAAQVPGGFEDDPALLANLAILDLVDGRVAPEPP